MDRLLAAPADRVGRGGGAAGRVIHGLVDAGHLHAVLARLAEGVDNELGEAARLGHQAPPGLVEGVGGGAAVLQQNGGACGQSDLPSGRFLI